MQGVDRTRRVAELIRRALADIIRDRLPDRGLGLLSITATEITRDLSRATVFISLLGEEEDQERATKVLNEESSALRHELSRTLNLRHTPEINFRYDLRKARTPLYTQIVTKINFGGVSKIQGSAQLMP
jgi:ribosome-binding factor A